MIISAKSTSFTVLVFRYMTIKLSQGEPDQLNQSPSLVVSNVYQLRQLS